jgi:hypothetical protein
MDTVFNGIGAELAAPEPSDYENDLETYHYRLKAMIEDARDYNETYLAPDREEATAYYKGMEPALTPVKDGDGQDKPEGRSTIIMTEVRDTVMAMMPSLMRIFTGHEHVVEFMPRTEPDVPLAEQATDYVSYVFWEDNPGYLTLYSAVKDALIRRVGVITWDTKVVDTVKVKHYKDIDEMQVRLTMELNPNATNMDIVPSSPGKYTLSLEFRQQEKVIEIEAVAPDEFRVDRNARTVNTADLIGWEKSLPGSDLVAMGYDRELVNRHRNASSNAVWNEERSMRNPALDAGSLSRDPNDEYVTYGEYYIKIDSDDDGIAELHLICAMGDEIEIVDDIIVDRRKVAVFSPEPEPHTVIGESISELVMDLQKIKTGIMRGSLDSIANTIYPRLVINQNTTNIDDVLNDEMGAPIRTKGDPSGSVSQLAHTFIGEPAFNMIGYLDNVRQQRTGISEASRGLDPKALQSTNVKGVDMVITGAQERIELVARNLCETGMKPLFKGLLQEITESPSAERIVRLRDKFVPVRPDAFDPTMDVRVNPAIGRGTDADRMMLLSNIKATQEQIIMQMGVSNPLVGPEEYRNTISDLLAVGNIKNVSRYFKKIDPEQLAALADQMARNKEPAQIIAEAEVEKIRADTAKAIGKQQTDREKSQMDDDFRRDKLEVDTAVKLIEIGADANIRDSSTAVRAVTDMERVASSERTSEADRISAAEQNRQKMEADVNAPSAT